MTSVFVLLILIGLLLLFVLGFVVVGFALQLVWWVLIGLVIGALARLVLPGKQNIGLLFTVLAGVAASLLGGIVAHALDLGGFLEFIVAVALAAGFVALLSGSQRAANPLL